MEKAKVLFVGESWVSASTHFKGWDFFSSAVYEIGIEELIGIFMRNNIQVDHMPSHIAAKDFPATVNSLKAYDILILSDIGSNTLLLHPDVWLKGKSIPNRLNVIKDWVNEGGGFMMCGGYLSFSGIYGSAKYYDTVIEEILPVRMKKYDDRKELPEGGIINVIKKDDILLEGIPDSWPKLLGNNTLELKENANEILRINSDPLLITGNYGQGRTLAWASDVGPHWCPQSFIDWPGYEKLWINMISWLKN
jgi:uncharacterized membrane protein